MYNKEKLVEYLFEFVTQERKEGFERVVKERTKYLSVVLEDVFQPHNASAVMRSCDCFGVQDLHVVEPGNEFIPDKEITMGSHKWVTVKTYDKNEKAIADCFDNLRADGFRIVATTPHTNDCNLHDFDVTKGPFALVFGSELPGLSDYALANADEYLKVPMYGFTESLNISVSVAIILQHLTNEIRRCNVNWELSNEHRNERLDAWLRGSIINSDQIGERWVEMQNELTSGF
jgi:tRNA (guanosine-2'-O-)-methyltransferase